ncbi:oligopeptide/dipeptide ABC transporter ATP-binding protein [Aquisalimonas asiatica]|uniref:Oligopeptide/dipeptide ABC transporter, ATP-binding protein, C-terminal domain-containing protein n=1 Tax=Aquisalimonas asiatica TaxID=406100 RepID=A0A1H8S4R5_9GAMM|nr:ABC transporter ATP-binding protein [Aquisalimonas asiatica]SEO73537.1 oligopeptide/dipeptide ABC transporter, ATP-binding protein, C-terminal domain-containing protein [Aquisalimonas asiatica]
MSALLEVRSLEKLYPVAGDLPFWLERARAWANHRKPHRPRLHAVDGVSIEVAAGESVGLVGESGCGKSTLVGLINRLIEPTRGAIFFDGEDISKISVGKFPTHQRRGDIQVVFQDPHGSLNPRFTAFDCIAEPLRRIRGASNDNIAAKVEELATSVGLPLELLDRLPHQLSGGQKARVNIARALAPDPRLLILDEPTSALDVSVQAVVLQLLTDLRRERGISYLFISHDLNVVRLLCERVVVMYLGQAVEEGPADEVFRAPKHPYTQALISAIPAPNAQRDPNRLRARGELQSPIDPPPNACRFYGRCPRGDAYCGQAAPGFSEVGPAHRAACHYVAVDDGRSVVTEGKNP